MEIKCKFCSNDFSAVRLSAVFCSSKCRTYYNRLYRTPLVDRKLYVVVNNVKQEATVELLKGLLIKLESPMDLVRRENITKEISDMIDRKDYQGIFNECHISADAKALLALIESDESLDEKLKNSWRNRLNGGK